MRIDGLNGVEVVRRPTTYIIISNEMDVRRHDFMQGGAFGDKMAELAGQSNRRPQIN